MRLPRRIADLTRLVMLLRFADRQRKLRLSEMPAAGRVILLATVGNVNRLFFSGRFCARAGALASDELSSNGHGPLSPTRGSNRRLVLADPQFILAGARLSRDAALAMAEDTDDVSRLYGKKLVAKSCGGADIIATEIVTHLGISVPRLKQKL